MSKIYVLSINAYDGKITRYASEQQASAQGVRAVVIEADSYKDACEILKEEYLTKEKEE
jgi:hypothetical protein